MHILLQTAPTAPASTGTGWGDMILGAMASLTALLAFFNLYLWPKIKETLANIQTAAASAKTQADHNERAILEHSKDIRSVNEQITSLAAATPPPNTTDATPEVVETLKHIESKLSNLSDTLSSNH